MSNMKLSAKATHDGHEGEAKSLDMIVVVSTINNKNIIKKKRHKKMGRSGTNFMHNSGNLGA